MPLAGVFTFFTKYGNVNVVYGQVLQASPRHVAKSLAENLCKVAIKSQQSDVVMQTLGARLIQVKEIVCYSGGQRWSEVNSARASSSTS
jgi:hypothetical protein